MCLIIDNRVKSLNKRTVWKIFDKQGGKIVSLFMAAVYPKGKLIERSRSRLSPRRGDIGEEGLHFYLSKSKAKREAAGWHGSYIAKFEVDPKDFMFAGTSISKGEVMYERATRVGNFIRIG
jgi:hypothetical protein